MQAGAAIALGTQSESDEELPLGLTETEEAKISSTKRKESKDRPVASTGIP